MWTTIRCLLLLLFGACAAVDADPGATAPPVADAPAALLGFPDNVSGWPAEVSYPALAANARGDTVLVWTRVTKKDFSHWGPGSVLSVVEASFRPAGAWFWGPTQRISVENKFCIFPSAAVDAQGRVVVSWLEQTESYDVVAVTRSTGGTWSSAHSLTTGAARLIDQTRSDLAVDAQGNATLLWHQLDERALMVATAARYDAASATWGAAAPLDPGGDSASWTDLFVDARGDAYVAYLGDATESTPLLRLRRRPAGSATWLPAEDAASVTGASAFGITPSLVVDAAGTITIAWLEPEGAPGAAEVVRVVARSARGSWSPKMTLSAPQNGPSNSFYGGPMPRLGVDAAGNVVAAWAQLGTGPNGNATSVIQAATRPNAGIWSAPVSLSAANDLSFNPHLVVAANGAASVSWTHSAWLNQAVQRSARPNAPNAAWSPAKDLFFGGYAWTPDATIDASGNATYAWERTAESLGLLGIVEAWGESIRQPLPAHAGSAASGRWWRRRFHQDWPRGRWPGGPRPGRTRRIHRRAAAERRTRRLVPRQ